MNRKWIRNGEINLKVNGKQVEASFDELAHAGGKVKSREPLATGHILPVETGSLPLTRSDKHT